MDLSLWGLHTNSEGHLVFGGCDLLKLARQCGTPLHVVDEGALRNNCRRFIHAFADHHPNTMALYSYKTNCIPGVLSILHDEGYGAEVVSPFELSLASRLGASPVVYNGAGRSAEEMIRAIGEGVELVNIDSAAEVRRLEKATEELGKSVGVGIRIDPEVGWKAHFGVRPKGDRVLCLFDELTKARFLRPCCLHAHVGTGITKVSVYERVIDVICSLLRDLKAKLDLELESIDLGGGFGVPTVKTMSLREVAFYKLFNVPPREPRAGHCASLEDFGKTLASALERRCERYGLRKPRVLLEPGRAITSGAQILLLGVREIKRRPQGATFAITDGGMQNLAFPLSYEYHACLLVNRPTAGPSRRYTVTGPLCSPEDLLYRNWTFPELQEGDVLAVMDAGAYFTSFSNNFSFPRPAVVLAFRGSHRVLRRRESFDDMTALDGLGPPRGPSDFRPARVENAARAGRLGE